METNNQANSNAGTNTKTANDTTGNTTGSASNSATNSGANAGSAANNGASGGSESANPLNDIMGMAAPYLGMLQDQAGRVPELLKTAQNTVTSSYKNMSTTTKVVTASALAVGVGLLVNNMRKNKKNGATNDYTSNSKKTSKNRA